MQTNAENRPPKAINVGNVREGISEGCGLRVSGLRIRGLLSPSPAALYRDRPSPLLDSALNLYLWQVLLLKTSSLLHQHALHGLSYWEAERSEKSYQLRFDFTSRELGEEIMERIRCKVSAAGEENTQIFLSSS